MSSVMTKPNEGQRAPRTGRGPSRTTLEGLSLARGTPERAIAEALRDHGPLLRTPLWHRVSAGRAVTHSEYTNALRRLREYEYVAADPNDKAWRLQPVALQILAQPINPASRLPARLPVQPGRLPVAGRPEPIQHPAELLTRGRVRPTMSHTELAGPVMRSGALDARALPSVRMGWRIWPDGRRERV